MDTIWWRVFVGNEKTDCEIPGLKIVIATGALWALCSSGRQETSPQIFLVQLQTLLELHSFSCIWEQFCLEMSKVGQLFFFLFQIPVCNRNSSHNFFLIHYITVACKLFRQRMTPVIRSWNRAISQTFCRSRSRLANNTDYKRPWKQVEFFGREPYFKLMATI